MAKDKWQTYQGQWPVDGGKALMSTGQSSGKLWPITGGLGSLGNGLHGALGMAPRAWVAQWQTAVILPCGLSD